MLRDKKHCLVACIIRARSHLKMLFHTLAAWAWQQHQQEVTLTSALGAPQSAVRLHVTAWTYDNAIKEALVSGAACYWCLTGAITGW